MEFDPDKYESLKETKKIMFYYQLQFKKINMQDNLCKKLKSKSSCSYTYSKKYKLLQ